MCGGLRVLSSNLQLKTLTSEKSGAATVVRKLWHYCNVLRNDGLSYPDYVEQLTYLLFLKMAQERGTVAIPNEYSWAELSKLDAPNLHRQYTAALETLGKRGGVLGVIFRNARNKIKDPKKLRFLVVELIGRLQWTELAADVKGDAYEGLLEKNAQDTKSGAGQYFTPRPLIDAIVECIRPQPTELVCDPACGTGGFLLAAHDFVQRPAGKKAAKSRAGRFLGVELVEEVARLATMNLLLHGVGHEEGDDFPIACEDSLAAPPRIQAEIVLTNPPFGIRGSVKDEPGANQSNDDFEVSRSDFWVRTANKQLNFLQHIYTLLKPGGRAGVVLPDNVLYERGAGVVMRRELLLNCRVHTLLRLPKGLFYAHGVTANVLFFEKLRAKERPSDDAVLWVYNLRSEKRFSLRKSPLQRSDLDDFVRKYQANSMGSRKESRVFRAFPVKQILTDPSCRLDFDWTHETPKPVRSSPSARLRKITSAISKDLQDALKAMARVSGRK